MNRNPITRRDFVRSTASLSLCLATQARGVIALPVPQSSGPVLTPAPFTVHYRQQPQYESLVPYIDPGHDAFPIEKEAAEITSHLKRLVETLTIPISSSFQGFSPVPLHYTPAGENAYRAEFDRSRLITDPAVYKKALLEWLDLFGPVRAARFHVLPQHRVRYEITSEDSAGLHHRV